MSEALPAKDTDPLKSDDIKTGKVIAELPPKTQLNINSIGLLDNVSTQLLKLLMTSSIETLIGFTSAQPDGYQSEVFEMLFALFKQVKKVYTSAPLLVVQDIAPGLWLEDEKCPYILKNQENLVLAAIRKANIVTYLLSIMGRLQYGFLFLDESFIEIFCPVASDLPFEAERALTTSLGRLLKPQAVLYLNLKTHAYISAIEPYKDNTEALSQVREEILDRIFAKNMEQFILAKRRMRSSKLSPSEEDFVKRCVHRREKLLSQNSLELLVAEHDWLEFFKEIFFYLQRNISVLVWGKKGCDFASPSSDLSSSDMNADPAAPSLNNGSAGSSRASSEPPTGSTGKSLSSSSSLRPSPAPVRDIASAKKLKQKRLWNKEEEGALIEALKVHGPAWSKILELHGAGGSLSESLKNRTQVQLKDKARNWKMYFLKGGLPVPEYLSKVTGDLERDEKSKQRFKNKTKKQSSTKAIENVEKSRESTQDLRNVANMTIVAQTARSEFSIEQQNAAEMDPQLQTT
ncbi:LAQU0S01e06788g1_1 [Lachancea quebecensis]|uniref:LAQU0S01e06788g1_1 n=1 Tax=Lachancea quebecensis TaxID=1654605 RepID=A0A0P1KM68_9SACH|nr:LAQU0S01e06788g1_1 [Lachancea quebecensis]